MPAIYAAVTPFLWPIVLGVCVLSWSLALAVYVFGKRGNRKLVDGYRQQLSALSSLATHHEHQREEYSGLLIEAKRELLALSGRHHELRTRLEALQQADVVQLRAGQSAREQLAQTVQRLTDSHKTNERFRSLIDEAAAEQRTLTEQLAGKVKACAVAERLLQESTSAQQQLRNELRAVIQGREQLELQNLELKRALDQLGSSRLALSEPARSRPDDEPISTGETAGVADEWQSLTDADIHQVIVGVAEEPLEMARAEAAVSSALPSADRELREARCKIGVLESSISDLEYLRARNAQLSDEQAQDRGAARELTALQLEHKRLRLELQVAGERLVTQTQRLERLAELESELRERTAELESLQGLRRQVRELDAENFALRNANSGTYHVVKPVSGFESESREVAVAPLDAAVLSDNLGLPIAGRGAHCESLAAVSGLALSSAERVRELLPVGPITAVQWADEYGMTVTCKLLHLASDEMAMTTLGVGAPSEDAMRETLRSVLSSIGWNEKGPVVEDESNAANG
jgi:hypothetical protein